MLTSAKHAVVIWAEGVNVGQVFEGDVTINFHCSRSHGYIRAQIIHLNIIKKELVQHVGKKRPFFYGRDELKLIKPSFFLPINNLRDGEIFVIRQYLFMFVARQYFIYLRCQFINDDGHLWLVVLNSPNCVDQLAYSLVHAFDIPSNGIDSA